MSAPSGADVLGLPAWRAAWATLGVGDVAGLVPLHAELAAAYAQPHRHYHTARHLAECLGHLADLAPEADRPGEIAIALWFHDAIYDTRRQDNEARCADWAVRSCTAFGGDAAAARRLRDLVLATRHAAAPATRDEGVLVDADLAILGAEPTRFDEYERDIRREYRWVPGFLYRRKRRILLREFLERPALFCTASFRRKYEAAARRNLERSLEALR